MNDNSIFNINNINIYSILRDLLKNWWVIILAGLIGLMGTYTVIRGSFEPEYTSSAVYVVTPKESTGYKRSDKAIARNAITAFSGLVNQDIMIKRVTQSLGDIPWDANVVIENKNNTNIMTMSVTSPSPMESFLIIRYIMENYRDLSQYLNEDAIFEELRAPKIAEYPDNATVARYKALFAGVIGILLMSALIALLSILRDTVKTDYMFENQLGAIHYGTIGHENKNKTFKSKIKKNVKSILITSPIISFNFIEAINNVRVKMEYEHERKANKNVFMVSSACENEGKSTVVVNIALSLVKEGKSVIVLDGDLRKPALHKLLDIKPESVVDYIELLQGKKTLEEVMYVDKDSGLRIVMANKGHSSSYEYVKSEAMRDLIDTLSQMADYVIVDTPPMAMLSDAEAMADMVDFSLLVVRHDFSFKYDIRNSVTVLEDSNSKFLGCILNDFRNVPLPNSNSRYGNYNRRVEVQNG
ncbi:MAG: polysaccharide biosynthesis tyrosine autokinase [Lachnospiraceae bacterium]|nr:polysaccharide biosynthesis tyrosine autokinase [Lachnospiraceae bacterium]